MPKTPKNEPVTDEDSATANGATPAAENAAGPAKKRAAKSAKTAAAKKKTAAKKKSVSGAAKKTKAKQPTAKNEPSEPSDADIRLRAYFIAERRVQLALQGDPARDWIEARQQLIEESRQATS